MMNFRNVQLSFFVKTGGMISRPLFRGMAHIFMLHRVLPSSKREQYSFNKGLAITPETLQKHIRFLKSKGYRFISLDDLTELLDRNTSADDKYICLTLDDGYRDNFTHGLPVFEAEQVPVTVYVTNCFPKETALLWWYTLEELLLEKDELQFGSEHYRTSTIEEKSVVFHQIRRRILVLPQEELKALLPSLMHLPFERFQKDVRNLAADWESLRTYAQHPLVDLGTHTLNHLSLAHLSDEKVLEEMLRSRNEIEEKTGTKAKHFAYPYGGLENVTIRTMQLADRAGFQTAVLNHPGNVFLSHSQNRMALPRYPLGEDTSVEELHYILNGIRHFSVNGWQKCIRYR